MSGTPYFRGLPAQQLFDWLAAPTEPPKWRSDRLATNHPSGIRCLTGSASALAGAEPRKALT